MNYDSENRGRIQNAERAGQLIEFAGMKYGSATPTDIDGFIEKYNQAFVFFELKYKGAYLPEGQKLALTRIIDSMTAAGKKAVLFVAWHYVEDPNEKVMAADAEVVMLYFNGIWHDVKGKTLKEMTDRFMRWALPF